MSSTVYLHEASTRHGLYRAAQRRNIAPAGGAARLADLMHAIGGDAAALDDEHAAVPVPLWRVRQGAALFHEGAPVEGLHVVRTGALKCVRTSEDGYEQVLALATTGDVLGFDALYGGHSPVSAVALEDSSVFSLPLRELRQWRLWVPALDDALMRALSHQMARAGEVAEMMAAVAAEAKLARFLLWLSARSAAAGQSPRRLRLQMCRRDLASLLGVAHETVSRAFTTLADWGLVQVDNRDVEVLDLEGLRARARNTRGLAEEGRDATPLRAPRPTHPAAVWYGNAD